LPSLNKLHSDYKDNGLKVLLVDMQETKEIVTSFIRRNGYSPTVLLDTDGKVAEMYSVFGIPVVYLIDKQGKLVSKAVGYLDWSSQEMISKIEALINE